MGYWWTIAAGVVALMTGILSLAREYWSLRWPDQYKVREKRVFWVCIRIAFIVSAGLAWYAEHQRANLIDAELARERDLNTPRLSGIIEEVLNGYTPELHAVSLFVIVSIRNTGAPTIVEGWNMDVEFEGVKYQTERAAILDGYRLFDEQHRVVATFKRDYAIDEKTTSPIPSGGLARGWLRYLIRGMADEDMHKAGVKYTLHFTDVRGDSYTAVRISTGVKTPPAYFPGAEQPFKIPPDSGSTADK